MKTFWHIARISLGLVFIFSGFVKGIDPWGMAYKFTDYFNAWGMEWLTELAFPIGVLLSASEFIIGVALVLNIFISFFSLLSLMMMGFFTVLTLFIAINNPVTDCGCFGDALTLTNWETFAKNILFIAFAIVVFAYRKKYKPANFPLIATIMGAATVFVFAYLVDYSYNHLPIMDFRPYKTGVNIPESMQVPEGAPKDVYENTFHYKNKNTGEIEEFNQQNYPWQDTINWEFVSMDEPVLVQKGYEPPIHNFFIETPEGEDIKDFFLYDENYTFFYIAYNLEETDLSQMEAINQLADHAEANNMNFIGLTSSLTENIEEFRSSNDIHFELFNADEITLKTMIRSNPGLMLIKNGTIMEKWHFNDIPSAEELDMQLAYFSKLENKPN
ncbi:BT_3928 family protein [Sunxiuqinia sp. sy24]|uniref:BT_3928 family protein n=1 Tax=Sunxiuqinia sp. sy24 TaxID=3461495 RepID=UPI004045B681